MARYPGELCRGLRISSSNLTTSNRCNITNGLLIELMRFSTCQNLPMKIVLKWLELLCGKHWPPAELTWMKALHGIRQKYRRLTLCRRKDDLTEFCDSRFEFPTSRKSQKFKKARRRSIYYEQKSVTYRKVANDLSGELHSAKLKVDALQAQVSVLEKKVGHVYKKCA